MASLVVPPLVAVGAWGTRTVVALQIPGALDVVFAKPVAAALVEPAEEDVDNAATSATGIGAVEPWHSYCIQ